MFEHEYIIRVIKAGIQTAMAIFAGKDAVKSDIDIENYNITLSEDKLLEFMIKKYISEGKINEAENILFETIEFRKTKKNLETALFFYEELNKWDEDKLLKCNFSRSEVEQGLKDVRRLYKKD
ncbi:DUF6483 family protein [Clostridium sp. MB40-C1]|uniref:DUF6483 family protein n=1 Tax=Clostridium sp. MB40-C1 TaxID=3070996 RepID=UPI0027E014A0|nr:DUF6483 family protein [Clostridium sp. MB40-C1]WMJ79885.1 DUF6483 family protein [Clostridium sp. MB40-C1]